MGLMIPKSWATGSKVFILKYKLGLKKCRKKIFFQYGRRGGQWAEAEEGTVAQFRVEGG
jgi:hypothetical protein